MQLPNDFYNTCISLNTTAHHLRHLFILCKCKNKALMCWRKEKPVGVSRCLCPFSRCLCPHFNIYAGAKLRCSLCFFVLQKYTHLRIASHNWAVMWDMTYKVGVGGSESICSFTIHTLGCRGEACVLFKVLSLEDMLWSLFQSCGAGVFPPNNLCFTPPPPSLLWIYSCCISEHISPSEFPDDALYTSCCTERRRGYMSDAGVMYF